MMMVVVVFSGGHLLLYLSLVGTLTVEFHRHDHHHLSIDVTELHHR